MIKNLPKRGEHRKEGLKEKWEGGESLKERKRVSFSLEK